MEIRRFKNGDEKEVCKIIAKDLREENIKDYSKESIEKLILELNENTILKRSEFFHAYVVLDDKKIIGIGMIGPYWDSLTESSFFTIFIDPSYKGKGIGRKIIETLESDEYFKRANRVEIPASISALEFYRHFGYDFKRHDGVIGNITNEKGEYKLEKYPKESRQINRSIYNMKPYINNDWHNYYNFIYEVKKIVYKKYVEDCFGAWIEEDQQKYFENFINQVKDETYIIQLNGQDIGFYNGKTLKDGSYEIGNICIIPKYQGKGIGTQVLKDIIELHKNQDIHIQCFKQNPVGKLYERLGFIHTEETKYHYKMIKRK